MVLATEELDVVVALVEMEIEVATTLRAFQIAGKGAGFLGDGGPPPAGPFCYALHLLPGSPVNDGLMDVEEDRPVFLRVLDPLFHLVGFGIGFEVDHIAAILLQGKNFLDRGMPPFSRLHGTLRAAAVYPLALPVVSGIAYTVPLQRCGDLR